MILADATTLVAMSLIGQTALITKLLGKVTITDSTEREIKECLNALKPDATLPGPDAVEITYVDMGTPVLSRSESETLEAARRNNAKLLLSDDAVLREAAREEGIRVIGTAGILYAAKARGLIADARATLTQLKDTGYALSDECERTLLARVGG